LEQQWLTPAMSMREQRTRESSKFGILVELGFSGELGFMLSLTFIFVENNDLRMSPILLMFFILVIINLLK